MTSLFGSSHLVSGLVYHSYLFGWNIMDSMVMAMNARNLWNHVESSLKQVKQWWEPCQLHWSFHCADQERILGNLFANSAKPNQRVCIGAGWLDFGRSGLLRSLGATRVAASGCKWPVFRKSISARPACSMHVWMSINKYQYVSYDLTFWLIPLSGWVSLPQVFVCTNHTYPAELTGVNWATLTHPLSSPPSNLSHCDVS